MALVDTYYFVPGTISVSMIGAGTADHRALVSVTQGTKIRLSAQLLTSLTKKYADDLSFRTWLVTGLNTRFSSAYMRTDNYALRLPIYIYVRLDASTSGTAAQLIFSPYQYTIGGRVFTDTEHDLLANVLKTDVTEIYDRTKSVEAQLATQNGTTFTEETAVRTIAPANLDTNGTTYKQNYLYLRIGTINTDDKVTIPEGTLSTDYAKEQQSDSALEAMFRFNTEGTAITPQKPFTTLSFFASGVSAYVNRIITSLVSTAEQATAWADDHGLATTKSIASYVAYQLSLLNSKYLRKDQDDTTPYTLSMGNAIIGVKTTRIVKDEEGNDVEVEEWTNGDLSARGKADIGGNTTIGGTAAITGNTTIGGDADIAGKASVGTGVTLDARNTVLDVNGCAVIKGNTNMQDAYFGNPTPDPVSGIGTVNGASISNQGDIKARSMELSTSLKVPEIIYNRASVLVGINIQSPCGGVIEDRVELSNGLSGIAKLKLGEDDIAGSIQEGAMCWGYWHNMGDGKENTNASWEGSETMHDDRQGDIQYKGFDTVYFVIQHIYSPADKDKLTTEELAAFDKLEAYDKDGDIPNNSTVFKYELRNENATYTYDVYDEQNNLIHKKGDEVLDKDGNPQLLYGSHPYQQMNFGGRGNQKTKEYQGFTITTPNYTATYQNVGTWEWGDMAALVVRVSGLLDGFETLAGLAPGTWQNYYGTIETNLYYRGNINHIDVDRHFLYTTQSSNGMLDEGETETLSVSIRDNAFNNITKVYSIKVGDTTYKYDSAWTNEEQTVTGAWYKEVNGTKVYVGGSAAELTLSYNYSDFADEITRIPVVATYVTEKKTYSLEGRISIRKLAGTVTTMEIICSDTLISLNENKQFQFRLVTNTGFDRTKEAHSWKITRESSDSASDGVWNAGAKALAFSQQHYVEEAAIAIKWSEGADNDLDPNPAVNITTFTVTAKIGEEEVEGVIEY